MGRARHTMVTAAARPYAHFRVIRRVIALVVLLVMGAFATAGPAQTHPHVWVTMTTELLYAPDGAATGVRHGWTFDDMYSAFATTGMQGKTKGQFTREELAPLAQVNVESLKEYDYFTYANINGQRVKNAFNAPIDYWLEYDPKETVLTLRFTLPCGTPSRAGRSVHGNSP